MVRLYTIFSALFNELNTVCPSFPLLIRFAGRPLSPLDATAAVVTCIDRHVVDLSFSTGYGLLLSTVKTQASLSASIGPTHSLWEALVEEIGLGP